MIKTAELKSFLDFKVDQYNRPEFVETDPIQIPHLFNKKEDIEIAGFLTATIAWGNRKSILKNAHSLMESMDKAPYDFTMNHKKMTLGYLIILFTGLLTKKIFVFSFPLFKTFTGIMEVLKISLPKILKKPLFKIVFMNLKRSFLNCHTYTGRRNTLAIQKKILPQKGSICF